MDSWQPDQRFLDYLTKQWFEKLDEAYLEVPLRGSSERWEITHRQILERMRSGIMPDGEPDEFARLIYSALNHLEEPGFFEYLNRLRAN